MRPLLPRLASPFLIAFATLAVDRARSQCLHWGTEFAATPLPEVFALASFDDGNGPAVFVATTQYVMRWDGSGWAVVGDGTGFQADAGQSYLPYVAALQAYDDGGGPKLYAGGRFESVDGTSAVGLATWDGVVWTSAADPFNSAAATVQALAVLDDGGGAALYRSTQGVQSNPGNVARFDGVSWTSIGDFLNGAFGSVELFALASHDDGGGPALYAAGRFASAAGTPAQNVARFDPATSTWSAVGPGLDNDVFALRSHDDGSGPALIAGGLFLQNIAAWDGASWSAVGGGANDAVRCLTEFDDGEGNALYAGGNFTHVGSTSAQRIARWNGTGWSALGNGITWPDHRSLAVRALAGHVDGPGATPSLFAGGRFGRAGDTASVHIARWQGCASPIDTFCFGDGTLAPCPCGNTGTSQRGCQNSLSTGGGRMTATGSANPDTLSLHTSGELFGSLTIFLQGNARIPASALFGDGLRCTGGALKRLYVKSAIDGMANAPSGSDPSISARSAALGDPIASGSVRYYQAYYRDSTAGFCPAPAGSTFNATSGVRVEW